MTRDEALVQLRIGPGINEDVSEEYDEAVDMAIEALEQQPSEDCVSREAVLSIIKSICFSEEYAQFRADYGSNGQRDAAIIYIKALPSVAPQPSEHTEERTETHECESKADKALNLLAEWVIECGFGYDNIPEEYEKYKDDIAEMGYREGLIYIVKRESEVQE